jgi:hypothetical protein
LGRGLIDPTDELLVHSAPPVLTAEVADQTRQRLAFGRDLKATQESPIFRLRRDGDRVVREDIWPGDADRETPVMLPGGEVGVLKKWWNAEDQSAWRWQIELYNAID